ncbi:LAAT1-like protein [Mya arenaria]|uniref:LAAT1-like protein n=1 Tax=Mya arenaria TaxID=6604 RepID=A0ABY7EX53_MYAAR|nr:LAAT1-like protein [Mya arenaria]
MPWQPLLFDVPPSNISDNCSQGVQWIYHVLQDCVYDAQGIASEILGLASIVTWMIVSIQGISLLLILMWTLGDTANLVGGILTKQLPLQIYLAVYFVFADLVLFAQFLYYNCYWKKKYKDYEPIPSTSTKSVGVGTSNGNYKRQSTDGLSIMMFILAVLGNLTYGLSILVRQLDVNYILKHLPWLIGSLGVIFLDLSLLVQFKYYEKTDDMNSLLKQPILNDTVLPDEVEVYVPAHRDHSASVNSITTASVNSYTIN